jgi:hypothetical protein
MVWFFSHFLKIHFWSWILVMTDDNEKTYWYMHVNVKINNPWKFKVCPFLSILAFVVLKGMRLKYCEGLSFSSLIWRTAPFSHLLISTQKGMWKIYSNSDPHRSQKNIIHALIGQYNSMKRIHMRGYYKLLCCEPLKSKTERWNTCM